ncbi:MAG: hypothetical protein JSW00_17525 [Thermoplasmata archaeon]|nr:MAG: hypothetical protein JSW00_17525 [Thermoplasmata archaeon]
MKDAASKKIQKGNQKVDSNQRLFKKIQEEVKGLKKKDFILRIISKLETNPGISNFWFSLGLLLSESGKYESANEAFNRVVILNPEHKKLWTAKAVALGNLGRDEEAAYCHKRALMCYNGGREENREIKELVRDIDDLVNEVEKRKKQLGLGDMKREDIEYLTPNVLDLEGFIHELLSERAKDKKWAKDLIIKMRILESRAKIPPR